MANLSTPEALLTIDGKLLEAEGGRHFDDVNPATGQVIGAIPDAGPRDLDAAVHAARRTFDETDWSHNHELRSRCLSQLYDALRAERESLRALLVAESGIPIGLTTGSPVDLALELLPYFSDLARTYEYETKLNDLVLGEVANHRLIRREPIGVVGAITPWNFPLLIAIRKVATALASGCTVVLKPPPDTPWTSLELGHIAATSTDLPPGVFNVVSSADHSIGEQLVRDPRVDMVDFTGSTVTGRRIMSVGSQTVKRVCLELGGKSANVLLDDADFERIIPGAVRGVYRHSGQGCAYLTRLLLPRSRYTEGVEIAVAATREMPYGDPLDPAVQQGPVISQRQHERVLSYIEKGRLEARLAAGGGVPAHLPNGWFVEPTLFVDADPTATIAQEEIFGPVVTVIPYDDEDDAIAIANNTIYGLAGSVWSADSDRALALARRVRAGNVDVNGATWFAPDSPFGGVKQSGLGREGGTFGFEEHMELKTLTYI
jgi:aldehyde dehydrogenase (NAD+)